LAGHSWGRLVRIVIKRLQKAPRANVAVLATTEEQLLLGAASQRQGCRAVATVSGEGLEILPLMYAHVVLSEECHIPGFDGSIFAA